MAGVIKSLAAGRVLAMTVIAATALTITACGGDADETATPTTSPDSGSAELSGTIEIDGSSTVAPVSEAMAAEFGKIHRDVNVIVGISGTGGGFERFYAGETDISDASRTIKDSEAAIAAENGIEYYELLVGTDGLSVMVHPNNDFASCLTVAELKMIWEPGSEIDN